MGRRHLTIVHGEPTDLVEVEELNVFYDKLSDIMDCAEWARLAGSDDYVTLTVGGRRRDEDACASELISPVAGGDPQISTARTIAEIAHTNGPPSAVLTGSAPKGSERVLAGWRPRGPSWTC